MPTLSQPPYLRFPDPIRFTMNQFSSSASPIESPDTLEGWLDDLQVPCGAAPEIVLGGSDDDRRSAFVLPGTTGERPTGSSSGAQVGQPPVIGGVCVTSAELSGFDDEDDDFSESETTAPEEGEEDEFEDFDDIDDEDFDDDFDDDFEEELEDDYEIEIEDEISAEFGLSGVVDSDDDEELEELDVEDVDLDDDIVD